MQPNVNLLALVGALLLSGCLHPSNTPPLPAATEPAAEAPAVGPQLLHIYVDCALPKETTERNQALAQTVALTLRDQLRQRGYDVRGAESIVRNGTASTAPSDSIGQLSLLVRTVTAGTPPPTATRYATYLHPNAPRLLLFASLLPGTATTPRHETNLSLGGLLTDSATGDILWSGQTSSRASGDDQSLRRLVTKLLVSLEPQRPQ